jgi:tellurite methyltransferase
MHGCAPAFPFRGASIEFFDRQFRRQIDAGDYALNPFETAALPFLTGDVLDLGCGLGNLSLAAAKQGARVTALDACATAVENLARRAREEGLDIATGAVDLRDWRPDRQWDAAACIGLLMFFPPDAARAGLAAVRGAVRPGGVAVVNVLIEGTTYLEMFDASGHCLFAPGELARAFAGWEVLRRSIDDFAAPGGTLKRFETVIARAPR